LDARSLLTLPGVPRRALSAGAGWLARRRLPPALRRLLWPRLARRLGIPRDEVPGAWTDYPSFLDLFTRPLPPGARPLPPGDDWLAPADGVLVASETVRPEGSWLVKGVPYATHELLAGYDDAEVEGWAGHQVYLSPRDYHRLHAPCDLRVLSARTHSGDLLPVDPGLVRRSHRVLARNRRILLRCAAADGEPLALLLVGALNVGGMRFPFDATLGAAPWFDHERTYDPPPTLARGDELGTFLLGSTVVLFARGERRPRVAVGGRCRARTPFLVEQDAPLP